MTQHEIERKSLSFPQGYQIQIDSTVPGGGYLTSPQGAKFIVVVSVSGGKDSTALVLALREAGVPAVYAFADTQWEAPDTYAYLDTLRKTLGIEINVVGVEGGMMGMSRKYATFPGRMQRWCTRKLKLEPLRKWHDQLIEKHPDFETIAAMGVRSQESQARSRLTAWEDDADWGGYIWRPLIDWTVEDVINTHKRHELPMNPLYHKGFDRVGCFPCIFENKEGIRTLAMTYPDRIDVLREAEAEITELRRQRNEATPGKFKYPEATYFQTVKKGFSGIDFRSG